MKNIAIFASGKGSNADNICKYFEAHPTIKVTLIVSDRKEAGVFQVALQNGIASIYINKKDWSAPYILLKELNNYNITFIVLAGFLKLIPLMLIQAYPGKIINIHPALLPKFGGHGMYGHLVHQAVHESGETETGITIHYVDEHYDKGDIIFQASVLLTNKDSPEIIAAKIHKLEMEHYPLTIERLIG